MGLNAPHLMMFTIDDEICTIALVVQCDLLLQVALNLPEPPQLLDRLDREVVPDDRLVILGAWEPLRDVNRGSLENRSCSCDFSGEIATHNPKRHGCYPSIPLRPQTQSQ